jgi:RHS repeat-associated protein
MQMPGRKYGAASRYRYGFNGKEEDDEVKGDGNQQDYGMRIYDTRLGRFLSVDPLTKSYPHYTPYSYAGNKPIRFIDLDGAEEREHPYNFIDFMNWVGGHSPNDNPFNKDNPVGKLNDNFNPVAIINNYACKLSYGKDSHREPIDSRGKLGVLTDLGTDVILYVSGEKLFKVVLGPKNSLQVLEQQAAKNEAATGAVKSNPTVEVTTESAKKIEVGEYGAMTKTYGKTGMSADHIPSFGSIKKSVETSIGRKLTLQEAKNLRKSTLTMVYETEIHEEVSRTFAGRNNPMQIAKDARNLVEAVQKDIQALTPRLLKSGYSQADIKAAQQTLSERYLPHK